MYWPWFLFASSKQARKQNKTLKLSMKALQMRMSNKEVEPSTATSTLQNQPVSHSAVTILS
jgi:hypothetical protein